MNAMLNISSASGVLTPDEVPAITSGTINSETKLTGALKLIRMRPWLSYAAALLQGVAGALAVLYLLGAIALGVALLFYTFNR
jgi:hypothetical protein